MASYGYTFNSGDGVTPTRLNAARTVSDIVNADIKSDAAIAGTKISPDFGSQNIQTTGNLAFGGTGNRITGDFSNATIASRVMIQTSAANSVTNLYAIPSGTQNAAAFTVANNSNPVNASVAQIAIDGTVARVSSGRIGSGTFLPLIFNTSDTERLRIDASGNVGIGTSSPAAPLHVARSASGALRITGGSGDYTAAQIINTSGVELQIYANGNSAAGLLAATNHPLLLHTNNTERMRIKSTGQVRFIPLSSDPAGAESGDVYYNSSTNKLRVHNGSSWVDLH